ALHRLLDAADDAVLAEVEVVEVGVAGPLAGGDRVEDRLHAGGELGVHEPPELELQEVRGRERRERRHELLPDLAGVAAREDRVDDRGVGAGAADALGLQHLHEAGVGVPRRRLRLVPQRLHAPALERRAPGERRQGLLAVVESGLGVVRALDVGAEVAGEDDRAAGGAEGEDRLGRGAGEVEGGGHYAAVGQPRLDARGDRLQPGVPHLRGDGALPDQVVEAGLYAAPPVLVRREHLRARGPYRLVRLLGQLRALLVAARRVGLVLLAVAAPDRRAGGVRGLVREVHRVGAHVGDVAVLVQRLRHAHRLARREAELAAGLLLQRRGRERRGGGARLLALLDLDDPPRGALGGLRQGARGPLVEQR